VTRETFWGISHTGEVVFYYLAAVTIVVFAWGVYDRFARYAEGTEDWFDRLDDLPGRITSAAKVVGSNEKQFNRDLVGGIMHSFILWGFLTLLIGTTILAIDIDIYRNLTQLLTGERQSFFIGDFYLSYSLVMDFMGLLFVVGATSRRRPACVAPTPVARTTSSSGRCSCSASAATSRRGCASSVPPRSPPAASSSSRSSGSRSSAGSSPT